VLLLALRDREGTIPLGSMYAYAVAGALLAELIVRRRLELVGSAKKRTVQLVDPQPIGEALLDESLQRIGGTKRTAALSTWVARLAETKQLRHRVAERLCHRGILRREEREVLLLFRRRVYPAVNPEPEREIVARLRRAIFTQVRDTEARTIVLLSVARSASLLAMVFDKTELKQQRRRVEELVADEPIGYAVKKAIEAAQSS
jgi:ribosome-interacting GTPase 1